MRKTITLTSITLILLASFLVSYAPPPERYYYVSLKGDVVRNTLDTYPEFSFFDFTFNALGNNNYSLQGYAKDKDGNVLGDQIILDPIMDHPAKPLKNLQKGHLYLTSDVMQANDVDGSEDYILSPTKTKDKSGHLVDYVSYHFNNKPDPDSINFLAAYTTVKDFYLNPSPPY